MTYEVRLDYTVVAKSEAKAREKAAKYIAVKMVKECVATPGDIFGRMRKERGSSKEHFVVFHLNTQNEIINKDVVSIGTLNASVVHPREVFRSAITGRCASVILAHNHPSGSVDPSEEDIAVTERLKEAGVLLGIEVLDHVIVTASGYKSLKELIH